jgi:hypothetical protein
LRPGIFCALLVAVDSQQVGVFPLIDDECQLPSAGRAKDDCKRVWASKAGVLVSVM